MDTFEGLEQGTLYLSVALRQHLKTSGILTKIESSYRREIFESFASPANHTTAPVPAISRETQVLNRLVQEYLSLSNYKDSLAVFNLEAGVPAESARIQNDDLSGFEQLSVDVTGFPADVPLLYGFVFGDAKHERKAVKKRTVKQAH